MKTKRRDENDKVGKLKTSRLMSEVSSDNGEFYPDPDVILIFQPLIYLCVLSLRHSVSSFLHQTKNIWMVPRFGVVVLLCYMLFDSRTLFKVRLCLV